MPTKNKIDNLSLKLVRLITAALFIAVIAGTWDVWWHGAMGRDSFWEPPHLLLYTSIFCAIFLGLYGWRTTKQPVWRRIGLVLLLILVAAPFDELWHRIFGIESALTPLIVWSPPHLVLVGSIIASFCMLLPALRKDPDPFVKNVFASLIFASILSLLMFVVSPLHPIGSYAVLGFWGAFFIAFPFLLTLLIARRWMNVFLGAFLVSIVFIALTAIDLGETTGSGTLVPPHDHPPAWVTVFSTLLAGLIIDMHKNKRWLIGLVAGLVWGTLVYGLSNVFFEPQFQYSLSSLLIAIGMSALGGLAAGIITDKADPRNILQNTKL